jgi:hypothetical protein
MAQVVELLPLKCEVLVPVPSKKSDWLTSILCRTQDCVFHPCVIVH